MVLPAGCRSTLVVLAPPPRGAPRKVHPVHPVHPVRRFEPNIDHPIDGAKRAIRTSFFVVIAFVVYNFVIALPSYHLFYRATRPSAFLLFPHSESQRRDTSYCCHIGFLTIEQRNLAHRLRHAPSERST
jgi:hypothetical protein